MGLPARIDIATTEQEVRDAVIDFNEEIVREPSDREVVGT
jgi:hypothetical protein